MSHWDRIRIKSLHMSSYEIAALVIIMLAIGLRIFFLAVGMPEINGDEGTMGVEAMHIAFQGQHPVFLYEQDYMGVLEAYIAAVFFHLFGVSAFTLRIGMVIMFLLFLVSMYFLTSLLYSKKLALVTLALLGFGATSDVLIQQLRAVGGAIETLLFGSIVLLLAVWLALTAGQIQSRRLKLWRMTAYSGWGLAAGLGLWTHFLVAPFVLAGGLILVVFRYRDLLSVAPVLLLLALFIGLYPFIIYNIHAAPDHRTLYVLQQVQGGTYAGGVNSQHLLRKRILGPTLWSLPIATGLTPVCSLTDLPYYGTPTPATLPCIVVQGGCSLGYLALIALAAIFAVAALWKLCQSRLVRKVDWTQEKRAAAIVQFSRLMILLSAVITLYLYVRSPLSGLRPWSTRYLVGLLIATPAVLWPIWRGAGLENFRLQSLAKILVVFSRGILALLVVAILAGTVTTFVSLPSVEADNQRLLPLVISFNAGETRVYSGDSSGGYTLAC